MSASDLSIDDVIKAIILKLDALEVGRCIPHYLAIIAVTDSLAEFADVIASAMHLH